MGALVRPNMLNMPKSGAEVIQNMPIHSLQFLVFIIISCHFFGEDRRNPDFDKPDDMT